MTKVELYKSRTLLAVIHAFALCQFVYAFYYHKFEPQKGAKVKDLDTLKMSVPSTLEKKIIYLTYWGLVSRKITHKIKLFNQLDTIF